MREIHAIEGGLGRLLALLTILARLPVLAGATNAFGFPSSIAARSRTASSLFPFAAAGQFLSFLHRPCAAASSLPPASPASPTCPNLSVALSAQRTPQSPVHNARLRLSHPFEPRATLRKVSLPTQQPRRRPLNCVPSSVARRSSILGTDLTITKMCSRIENRPLKRGLTSGPLPGDGHLPAKLATTARSAHRAGADTTKIAKNRRLTGQPVW